MSDIKERKKKKIKAILKLILLLIVVLGIPAYIFFFQNDLFTQMSSVDEMETIFVDYRFWGYGLIVFFQALQIVISIIPSQWIQIAGAFAYGFGLTAVFSIIGTIIGTVAAYYIAKVLGRDALTLFMKEEKINELVEKLNSKKAMIFVAVIYFVPGIPKDLCNFAAGVSSMNLRAFLIISIVARTPAMMTSILVGQQVADGQYTSVIVITVIMVILFVLGAIFRKKVYNFVDIAYGKITRNGETEEERVKRRKEKHQKEKEKQQKKNVKQTK